MIPKGLYEVLDARRHTTSLKDERIREYALVNLCYVISKTKFDGLLKIAKDIFRSKNRVKKIMLENILKQFLEEH